MKRTLMRLWLAIGLVVIFIQSFEARGGEQIYPSCHLHRSQEVSFRNHSSKDILEISIGGGPCYSATMTIVIRTEHGEILYSYVAPFKRHIAVDWRDNDLDKDAERFVDRTIAKAMGTTANLPPFLEPEAYYEANDGSIEVPKAEYEKLRKEARPMFYHMTYYEGWQFVVYDEKERKSRVIVSGGL